MPLSSSPLETLSSEPVTRSATTINTACVMNALAELRTPELAATAGGRPCFWKNRMLSVALPAVPPTSPVNALANCTPVTGPSGSRAETAPSMATACEICGSWPRTKVPSTHPEDGPGEDVADRGDVRQLGHQQVHAEGERRRYEHGADREPVQLRRRGRLHAGERRSLLPASLLQQRLGVGEVPLRRAGQRRRLWHQGE